MHEVGRQVNSSSSSSSREKEQLNEPVEKGWDRKDYVETRDDGLLGGRRVGRLANTGKVNRQQ